MHDSRACCRVSGTGTATVPPATATWMGCMVRRCVDSSMRVSAVSASLRGSVRLSYGLQRERWLCKCLCVCVCVWWLCDV